MTKKKAVSVGTRGTSAPATSAPATPYESMNNAELVRRLKQADEENRSLLRDKRTLLEENQSLLEENRSLLEDKRTPSEEKRQIDQKYKARSAKLKNEEPGHRAYRMLVDMAEEAYGIEILKNEEPSSETLLGAGHESSRPALQTTWL